MVQMSPHSSGILYSINWQFVTDVSEQPIRPIFKGRTVQEQCQEHLDRGKDEQMLHILPAFKRGKEWATVKGGALTMNCTKYEVC
jgi:hypothetical protein